VPGDTIALAVIDLAAIRQTEFYKSLGKEHALPLPELGFDLEKDVDRIAIASDGKHTLIAAAGRFTAETPPGVVKIDQSRLVAGEPALIEQAIQRTRRGDSLPSSVAALAARVPKDSHVWAVATGGFRLALPDQANWRNLNRILGSVQSVHCWFDLSSGLQVKAVADAANEAEAQKLVRQWKGLMAMGRLAGGKNKELHRLFDLINLSTDGPSARLSAELPAAQVRVLLDAM
jgi:hypothetical protein